MRKVLQISDWYYPKFGGTEQVARDISNALNHYKDVEHKVICFNEDASDGDYVNHRNETVREFVDGVEIIRCGVFTKIFSQSLSLGYFWELKKVLDDFDPDVVILHYPNPFVTALLLLFSKKKFKLAVIGILTLPNRKSLSIYSMDRIRRSLGDLHIYLEQRKTMWICRPTLRIWEISGMCFHTLLTKSVSLFLKWRR